MHSRGLYTQKRGAGRAVRGIRWLAWKTQEGPLAEDTGVLEKLEKARKRVLPRRLEETQPCWGLDSSPVRPTRGF